MGNLLVFACKSGLERAALHGAPAALPVIAWMVPTHPHSAIRTRRAAMDAITDLHDPASVPVECFEGLPRPRQLLGENPVDRRRLVRNRQDESRGERNKSLQKAVQKAGGRVFPRNDGGETLSSRMR